MTYKVGLNKTKLPLRCVYYYIVWDETGGIEYLTASKMLTQDNINLLCSQHLPRSVVWY